MSYSSDLAQEHSYKRRQVVGSAWYQQLSQKQCILSDDRNRVKEFSNNSQGLMYARGADGSVTGVGALRIIGDDLNNPEKVESDVIREGCKKKWKDYSTTRQNDPKTTAIIIVQQRTHQDDISGYELSSPDAPKWKLIKLPTRCEKTETIVFPRSGRTIERSPESAIFRDKDGNEIKEMLGPYLHPDRFGKEEDDSARQKLGAYMYSGRHDQEPAPLEGGIFSLAKWQKWQNLPGKYELAISVDPSFGSTSKTASYVVVQLWAIAYPNFYLIHQKRKRCGFSETKQMIRDMVEEYSYLGFISRKLIEKKASGADIIEDLKEVFSGIVAISPKDDKEIRARAIAPYFESGNIWLPDNSIADDVETEFITFPNGSTDDQVDSAGQLILYYAKKNRSAKRLPATSFSIGG
jgi:predicted phage terminase large subunit-like protein